MVLQKKSVFPRGKIHLEVFWSLVLILITLLFALGLLTSSYPVYLKAANFLDLFGFHVAILKDILNCLGGKSELISFSALLNISARSIWLPIGWFSVRIYSDCFFCKWCHGRSFFAKCCPSKYSKFFSFSSLIWPNFLKLKKV